MKSIGATNAGGSGSIPIPNFLLNTPRRPHTSTITSCPNSLSCISTSCIGRWDHVALSKRAPCTISYTSLPSYSPVPISVWSSWIHTPRYPHPQTPKRLVGHPTPRDQYPSSQQKLDDWHPPCSPRLRAKYHMKSPNVQTQRLRPPNFRIVSRGRAVSRG